MGFVVIIATLVLILILVKNRLTGVPSPGAPAEKCALDSFLNGGASITKIRLSEEKLDGKDSGWFFQSGVEDAKYIRSKRSGEYIESLELTYEGVPIMKITFHDATPVHLLHGSDMVITHPNFTPSMTRTLRALLYRLREYAKEA